MGNVSIDRLAPGMLLGADVHDRNGRLLIRAGTDLTDKSIYVLRTWGVIQVDITGMENAENVCHANGAFDPALLASLEAEVKPMFRHADLNHPGMSELFRLCILRRAQHVNS
jgi:hypothetical protein